MEGESEAATAATAVNPNSFHSGLDDQAQRRAQQQAWARCERADANMKEQKRRNQALIAVTLECAAQANPPRHRPRATEQLQG